GAVIVVAPVVAVVVALCERADLTTPARAPGVEGRAHLLALWIVGGAAVLACAPRAADAVARYLTRRDRRLLAGAAVTAACVVLRRRRGALAAPAADACAAFVAHAVVDWGWEMPTVTIAALACAAAVLLLERETARVHRLSAPARVTVLIVALALAAGVLAAQ